MWKDPLMKGPNIQYLRSLSHGCNIHPNDPKLVLDELLGGTSERSMQQLLAMPSRIFKLSPFETNLTYRPVDFKCK